MPQKRDITVAASAVRDMEEIRVWYAGQQVPETGERILAEIIARIERHSEFPENGRVVPEFGIVTLREIIFPPFRIVYRIDKSRIGIVRIIRSERLLTVP